LRLGVGYQSGDFRSEKALGGMPCALMHLFG
jgi:hypothetical protein